MSLSQPPLLVVGLVLAAGLIARGPRAEPPAIGGAARRPESPCDGRSPTRPVGLWFSLAGVVRARVRGGRAGRLRCRSLGVPAR